MLPPAIPPQLLSLLVLLLASSEWTMMQVLRILMLIRTTSQSPQRFLHCSCPKVAPPEP
jgi:hypothetical protein